MGDGERFPATRHSVVAALAATDSRLAEPAWDALVRGYWRPVYAYLRHRWHLGHDDAQDFTQEFFARAHARGFFDGFDPSRAKFRTFLRVCLDRLVLRERESAGRVRRGGGAAHLSLDFEAAGGEFALAVPDAGADPEALFRREWIRALFASVVDAVRSRAEAAGRTVPFELFRLYDLEGPDAERKPTYRDLADRFGISVTQVTNHLSAMRRTFRREALDRLRAECGTEEEYLAEAAELFGPEAV